MVHPRIWSIARLFAIAPAIGAALGLLAAPAHGQLVERQRVVPKAGAAYQLAGQSVAVGDGVLVIGAWQDDTKKSNAGTVWVYRFDPATQAWGQEQQLFASDPVDDANFGMDVAVTGDTLFVGAQGAGGKSKNDVAGAVYVFRFDPVTATWNQEQKLFAAKGAAADWFGSSVAASGGVVVIGAPAADVGTNVNQGCAYVFRDQGPPTHWVEEAQLTGSNAGAVTQVFAVAFDGATAVLSAPVDDYAGFKDVGSLTIWTVNGTTWSWVADLLAPTPADSILFGARVEVRGDTLLTTATGEYVGRTRAAGTAHVFSRVNGQWTQSAFLPNPAPAWYDGFGSAMALGDGVAAVGGQSDEPAGGFNNGSAWLFREGRNGWQLDAELTASDRTDGDLFGCTIAIDDEHVVVGAPGCDVPGGTQWGAVYRFDSDEVNLEITPTDPVAGGNVHVEVFDGEPATPFVLTIEDLGGVPVFFVALQGLFAADHAFRADFDAPSPLLGLSVGVRAWEISPTGRLAASELVFVAL